MIDRITVGRGNARQNIDMIRDRDQRRSVAGAIKGFLFPTPAAHHQAIRQGKRNLAGAAA